jgi:hypothetical protein
MLGGKLSKEGSLVEFHRDPLFSPLVTGSRLLPRRLNSRLSGSNPVKPQGWFLKRGS